MFKKRNYAALAGEGAAPPAAASPGQSSSASGSDEPLVRAPSPSVSFALGADSAAAAASWPKVVVEEFQVEDAVSADSAPPRTTTTNKALVILVKSLIGTGILFMPRAFYNGGLLFSIVFLLLVGWLTFHCIVLLVEARKAVRAQDYGDIGLAVYGKHMQTLVQLSLFFGQLGVCCAYSIFVAQNYRYLAELVTDCAWTPSFALLIFAQMALYIPCAFITHMGNFAPVTLFGNVLIIIGLVFIYFEDMVVIMGVGESLSPASAPTEAIRLFNADSYALSIGTALFAVEGIGLMLPIESSMKQPAAFTRVLSIAMAVVGALLVLMGSLSYAAFREKTKVIIFQNLPRDSVSATLVQFFYTTAIFASFPLALFPCFAIIEPWVFGSSNGGSFVRTRALRIAIIFALCAVSFSAAHYLDRVVSLVGNLAFIPLSFIYPCVFHAKLFPEKRVVVYKNIAIAVAAAVAMVFLTYQTISRWNESPPEIDLCSK